MPDDDANAQEREGRLDEVLAAYLEAAERGSAPERARFLACHPEFADDLARFLDNQEALNPLAAVTLRAGAGSLRWIRTCWRGCGTSPRAVRVACRRCRRGS